MEQQRVPRLTDSFWREPLHAPTVLGRIRQELSEGWPEAISVAEVFQMAQLDLGFPAGACIFADGEVARPLSVVAAVWGHRVYGISNDRARSFGGFVGAHAGGDAILGPAADKLETQAGTLLTTRFGRGAELTPQQRDEMLAEVIAVYQA